MYSCDFLSQHLAGKEATIQLCKTFVIVSYNMYSLIFSGLTKLRKFLLMEILVSEEIGSHFHVQTLNVKFVLAYLVFELNFGSTKRMIGVWGVIWKYIVQKCVVDPRFVIYKKLRPVNTVRLSWHVNTIIEVVCASSIPKTNTSKRNMCEGPFLDST